MQVRRSLDLTIDFRSYLSDGCTHQHDYHQLVLPLEGTLEMQIENHAGDVALDRAAIIPAGVGHGFAGRGSNRFIVADVPVALAPELAKLPPFIRMDEGLGHFVLFLQHELQQGGQSPHSRHQMILLFVRMLTERYGEALKIDRRLETARKYLDSRLDMPVTLDELALVAHLSTRQLTELFRRYFGMSPRQYLTEQRMQLAWRLLTETRASVQEIADKCGYGNLSAFSSRFSRHFGCAPSHLRTRSAESGKNSAR